MRGLEVVVVVVSVLCAVGVGLVCADPVPMKRVTLTDAPSKGAVCLDGSTPMYYFRPATKPESANKWRLHLQGGGWCFSPSNCYSRSFTELGSSTTYPETIPDTSVVFAWPGGFMDSNATEAPEFGSWNAVWMMYCDGSSFTSNRSDPVVYNNTKLYMRGFPILNALLDDLEANHNALSAATDFVLAGTSAGGLATYIHSSHIRQRLNKDAFMIAYPDAGFFLDHATLQGQFKFRDLMMGAYPMWNSASGLNQACLAAQGGPSSPTAWKCLFAQYTFPFITELPVMVLNSLYDPVQYGNIDFGGCGGDLLKCNATMLAIAQQYRDEFQAVLESVVVSSPTAGLFATSCNQHEESCTEVDFDGIHISGSSQRQAVTSFFQSRGKNNATFIDVRWPNNPTCAPPGTRHGGC